MICPICKREGKKSKVYIRCQTTTCMAYPAYYDEDGKYIRDDPNTTTINYHCSNGHSFKIEECRGKIEVIEGMALSG